MKSLKCLCFIFLFLSFPALNLHADVKAVWEDPNNEEGTVDRYNIYVMLDSDAEKIGAPPNQEYKKDERGFPQGQNIRKSSVPSGVLEIVWDRSYFEENKLYIMWATAENDERGESDASTLAELKLLPKPKNPTKFEVMIVIIGGGE